MFISKGYLSQIRSRYVIDLDGGQVLSQNSYPYHYRTSHSEEVGKRQRKDRVQVDVLVLKK